MGGGTARAWPQWRHSCARPWLQGQASSPWTPGSVSCPNCSPESCVGTGGLPCLPGTALELCTSRGMAGDGHGQGAPAGTASPVSFGSSNCDIPPVHRITGGTSGHHPAQPGAGDTGHVGLGCPQRGKPQTCSGQLLRALPPPGKEILPRAEVGLAVFVYVQILPGWVLTPQLCHPLSHRGTCPQPCCCGTGSAWPGGPSRTLLIQGSSWE